MQKTNTRTIIIFNLYTILSQDYLNTKGTVIDNNILSKKFESKKHFFIHICKLDFNEFQ